MIPPRRTSPLLSASHGFFGRKGGVSEEPFQGLNGSFHSGDTFETVAENRRRICGALDADVVVTPKQTHSSTALFVDQAFPFDDRPEADALVTRTPGLAVAVLAADCVPILFQSDDLVAAAHAGWRGSLAGIIENTIHLMEEHGSMRSAIVAVIGPHLRAPHFEVRSDLIETVLKKYPTADEFFHQIGNEHSVFDHTGFVIHRLRAAGIEPEHISDVGGNTLESPGDYFSYRDACARSVRQFGHNLSAICGG